MSKKLLFGCGGLLVVVVCLGAVALVLGLAFTDGDEITARPVSDVTASPIPPAPSFEEIRAQHDAMTEAQWKNYRTQIEGTQARAWRGWVDEVTGAPGRYKVRVDMDSPDEILSIYEVSFAVPDDLALSLQVDQPVTFSGQIESAIDFVGSLAIELEYAEIN